MAGRVGPAIGRSLAAARHDGRKAVSKSEIRNPKSEIRNSYRTQLVL
jgi:hypothetical protein